jgi:hypothetical protein
MDAKLSIKISQLITAGDYSEAEDAIRRELALRPRNAQYLDMLGVCIYFQSRIEESIGHYHSALRLEKERSATWYNLGTSLSELGRVAEAIEAYRKCLSLDPDNEIAKYNLSRSLLLIGQWEEGWHLYESRGRKKNPLYAALDFDRWSGERPGGYVLVLSTEQGIGDAIQFVRFAGHLKGLGYEVLTLTDPKLVPLLKHVVNIGQVVAGAKLRIEGAPVKWSPLMSVPAAIGTTPTTIPQPPYIIADSASIARWATLIGQNGYKIGIAWQGNPAHPKDKSRSMHLAELWPLAKLSGVRLISLQKKPGSEQIIEVPFRDCIETFDDASDTSAHTLVDSAAMMMNLDLIISVDTATAHLAGAVGRAVWLALEHVPDWRWLLDRTDSPWYPTMRLFRQTTPGDWRTVVIAMANALQKLPRV